MWNNSIYRISFYPPYTVKVSYVGYSPVELKITIMSFSSMFSRNISLVMKMDA